MTAPDPTAGFTPDAIVVGTVDAGGRGATARLISSRSGEVALLSTLSLDSIEEAAAATGRRVCSALFSAL